MKGDTHCVVQYDSCIAVLSTKVSSVCGEETVLRWSALCHTPLFSMPHMSSGNSCSIQQTIGLHFYVLCPLHQHQLNLTLSYIGFLACDCEAVTHAIVIDICLSVCPSVCLSVKCVDCDKTKAPSEKRSIMTNRKSCMSFPMSLR